MATTISKTKKVTEAPAISRDKEVVESLLSDKKGTFYNVVAPGKVRRVSSFADIPKLGIDTDLAATNTTLYKFLKDKEVSTSQKRGWVECRCFRMQYNDKGFVIKDTLKNYQDISDAFADLPTPADVWAFIDTPKINPGNIKKPSVGAPKDKKPLPTNKNLVMAKKVIANKEKDLSKYKIKEIYKSVKLDKTIDEAVREHYTREMENKFSYLVEKTEIDFTEIRKKAKVMVKRVKLMDDVVKRVKAMVVNRSFLVFLGKEVRLWKAGKIRAPKLRNRILELLSDDTVFQEKKKPAPKFGSCDYHHIKELLEVTEDSVKYKNKTGEVVVKKSDLLARWLMHEDPRYNVGIAKFLEGAITKEQFSKEPIIRDRFQHFDFKALSNSHNPELEELILDELAYIQLHNPLNVVYVNMRPDLKVGTKVKVTFPDYNTYYKGVVIRVDEGISIRYEDGEVAPLMKHQEVTIINKEQK